MDNGNSKYYISVLFLHPSVYGIIVFLFNLNSAFFATFPTVGDDKREDEIKKHAPGLTAKCFHRSRKKRDETTICLNDPKAILDLNKVDVIISTSTFDWPPNGESLVVRQCMVRLALPNSVFFL